MNRLPSARRGPGLRVGEDVASTNNVTAGTGASCEAGGPYRIWDLLWSSPASPPMTLGGATPAREAVAGLICDSSSASSPRLFRLS